MTAPKLAEFLKRVPVFQGVDEEDLRLLAEGASTVRFEAGRYIYREGESAQQMFVVRSGRVALDVFVPHRGPTTIRRLGPGDLLGWSWMVPPHRSAFDVRALERTCAIAFEGEVMRRRFEDRPKLGYLLMRRLASLVADRLHATRHQLLDLHHADNRPGSPRAISTRDSDAGQDAGQRTRSIVRR
jgi:CRP-like cAMP-binding protein